MQRTPRLRLGSIPDVTGAGLLIRDVGCVCTMSLSPEAEQSRDVYAHAGLALYWAQCFEMSLENFLVIHARLSDHSITLVELESYEEDVQRKTLGELLQEVRQRASFDSSAEKAIGDALQKRNYLAHRFFKDRAVDFLSADGKSRMVSELQDLQQCFQIADTVASAIAQATGKLLGVRDEMMEQEMKRLAQRP